MTKEKDQPKMAVVHAIEDFKPVIQIDRLPKSVIHMREDLCENYPCVVFPSTDSHEHPDGACGRFVYFDDEDMHGITDAISIQPTPDMDFCIIDAPCCTDGFALKPKQVLAMIAALQTAYQGMKK